MFQDQRRYTSLSHMSLQPIVNTTSRYLLRSVFSKLPRYLSGFALILPAFLCLTQGIFHCSNIAGVELVLVRHFDAVAVVALLGGDLINRSSGRPARDTNVLAREGGTDGRQEESAASEQGSRRDGERVQQGGERSVADDKETGSRGVDEGEERGDEAIVYVEDRPLIDELIADAQAVTNRLVSEGYLTDHGAASISDHSSTL